MSDSQEQAFTLLLHKKQKFIALINQALNSTTLDLFTLQRLSGKCMFLDLAIPGARLYSNDINLAISRATRSSRPIAVSNSLRKELQNSLFLDMWSCFLPWRSERHAHINSDSSSYPWGGIMFHVGWNSKGTALYYMKLAEVLRAGSPSDLLSSDACTSSTSTELYSDLNRLKDFV